MNFLVVTHSYAPDQTPRAFRWSAITEHWAAHDAHVDVVTSGRNAPDGDDRNGKVGIHRVGERAMGRMRLGFGEGAVAGRPQSATSGLYHAMVRAAKAAYDITWKQVYWPDYACLWYPSALAEAKPLCRHKRYDAVITVSHPFTGHLVGLSLKRVYRAVTN